MMESDIKNPSDNNDWVLRQIFSTADNEILEEEDGDVITAVEFSREGEFVSLGDHNGRVWVYCTNRGRENVKPSNYNSRYENRQSSKESYDDYEFYGQFQSHDPEFDYLKSLEIDERINKLCWLPRTNNSINLLSTNDKTIKLWKIFEKPILKKSFQHLEPAQMDGNQPDYSQLPIPRMHNTEILTAAIPRRVFNSAHAFHIHSIGLCSDIQTFMSADDLRVNIWSLNSPDNSWCILDMKPENMEDLDETITCCCFHPTHCNVIAFTTGKGKCFLADLRQNANVKSYSKIFSNQDTIGPDFFSEITGQMSSLDFAYSNKIVTRSYTKASVWDSRYEKKPYKEFDMLKGASSQMETLYTNESLFDRFQVSCSGNNPSFATGAYGSFTVTNWETEQQCKCETRPKTIDNSNLMVDIDTQFNDRCKALVVDWHPDADIVGVGVGSRLYVYSNKRL